MTQKHTTLKEQHSHFPARCHSIKRNASRIAL